MLTSKLLKKPSERISKSSFQCHVAAKTKSRRKYIDIPNRDVKTFLEISIEADMIFDYTKTYDYNYWNEIEIDRI
jgi:hypothetical protein